MAHLPRPVHCEDFEIAIICALQVERDAVEALLDEVYETDGFSYRKSSEDPNTYTTGRVGEHHVVLAYIPGMGKASSAAVASSIRISFKGIKVGIVVGICGGAPRATDGTEIFLGDVIISEAAIQVDFGCQYPNKFIRKTTLEDNLGQANPQIRSFLGKVSGWSAHKRLTDKTLIYSTALYKRDGFHNSRYPGIENDKLYPAYYQHKHQNSDSCVICGQFQGYGDEVCETALNSSCAELGCDDTILIPRNRTKDAWKPSIHFGRIASGDGVMKSGQHRDEIVASEKVIAFEMEGAGAWDYLPTVVIKGVCNYADSHKSEEWQRYAVTTAAACTKAFLEEWRSEDRPSKRSTSPEISSSLSEERRLSTSAGEQSYSEDIKAMCLQSLSFLNIDSHRRNIAPAHQNTCDWLFATAQFQQWQNRDDFKSHNGVLWIKGKSGAGKSTLMKHALVHCQKSFPNHAIAAYFFNARGDHLEKSPLGMLRSLLYQLIEQNPQFCSRFIPLFLDEQKNNGIHWQWHSNLLEHFLLEMMGRHQSQPMLLFVDALDECDESQVRDVVSFLEKLSSATIRSGTILNICLSSRHYPTICMEKKLELVVEKRVEHGQDIAIYVQDKLKKIDEGIERELLEKAAGVFMWIILAIEMLNQKFDEGGIAAMRKTLSEMPGDLDEVFRTLLEKDNTRKYETILMLQWVLFSEHLLKPEELYFAVLAGTDGTESEDLGPWDQSKVTNQIIERFITTTSRGLIEVRKGDTETVQFIHQSVNDFLLRNKRLQTLDLALVPHVIGASHDRLASSCLCYVEMVKDSTPEKELVQSYPFLEYASSYVLYHAEQAHVGHIDQRTRLQQLQRESKVYERLKSFHNIFWRWPLKYGTETELLYVVSLRHYQGLARAVLLEPSVDVNAQSGLLGSALQAAAANVNVHNSAAAKEVIQVLLDAGADVNVQGGHFGSALQVASRGIATYDHHGYLFYNPPSTEVVRMLLDAGADVNAVCEHHGNALQAAVGGLRGYGDVIKEVIQMLLNAGADVNIQCGFYGNVLQAATAAASDRLGYTRAIVPLEVIQMLLDAGANVSAQGGYYGNALQAAAAVAATVCRYTGADTTTKVVEMLLDAGADVNAQGGRYGNALQAAAARKSTAVAKKAVQMLLDAGANVNALGGYYGSALKAAVACADGFYVDGDDYRPDDETSVVEVIQILLDAGADVNAQGGCYGSVLQAAAADTSTNYNTAAIEKIIQILLDAGADVNAQSGRYGCALQAAAVGAVNCYFHDTDDSVTAPPKEIIQMLLDAGADVNARGGHYGSVLQAADRHHTDDPAIEEIIQMLLDAGAENTLSRSSSELSDEDTEDINS
ncbi:hypothetical protein FGG08_005830 [Glutinoglossum americanum]|uniref:Uncharacterized protein n=1 Tax=Glutinoglossum americanum TaxID=1670608 RepID=A0A9P8HTT0_9PEZI|nr:hypothetical protein FGG08_005830 [Glutinoglossum americanum]